MPQRSTASESGQGLRSFAARHGAALAAGATALTLLAIAAAFVPYRHVEPLPPPPAHWFDDRAKLVSPGYAAGKSEYLQQYLPLILHASVLIVTEPRAPAARGRGLYGEGRERLAYRRAGPGRWRCAVRFP